MSADGSLRNALVIPRRGRGRQSAAAQAAYNDDLNAFCETIFKIRSGLDFEVSARGWGYILEEYGATKHDFDAIERIINDCRKSGLLPLDIAAVDQTRLPDHIEAIDDNDPEDRAQAIIDYIGRAHSNYQPHSFWEFQDHYIEMVVEKIDLKSLFTNICAEFHVPLWNAKGWSDINSRAAMMQRFAEQEAAGRTCVLLYCGDHDPAGLQISDAIRKNLYDLSQAVMWWPHRLVIERFGLNADFIERHGLTWIDNLITSGRSAEGKAMDLADPRHPDHQKPYVQSYIGQFGVRKVEANALVVRPEAGRELCRQAIAKYIDVGGVNAYDDVVTGKRLALKAEIERLMSGRTA